MSQEFCRLAVLADVGSVHEKEALIGTLPVGNVSAVRLTEVVLPSELALFLGHVPVAFEAPGPEDVPSGTGVTL